MEEERYVYCKTCGNWDKAWVQGYANKRQLTQQRWKRLTYNNQVYFGYKLIPCIENRHHVFQTALSKLQIIRKLKRRNTDAKTHRHIGNRMARISQY